MDQHRLVLPGLALTPTRAAGAPAEQGRQTLAGAPRAQGRFRNEAAPRPRRPGQSSGWQLLWRMLVDKPAEASPRAPIPVRAITAAQLMAAQDHSLYRLGHSSLLLKLQGGFWLVDPVFSKRASPLQWLGPKRFHAPPISLKELPPIEGVILSHDHYDHLDADAIRALAPKTRHFVSPLGVGERLRGLGVADHKLHQLDWWQSVERGGLRLTATPAQHFSGRSLSDRNQTLWASFVIESPEARVFFSGDSGYFAGFKTIGEHFGGFDLTLIETGAYNEDWPDVHMQPEESLQAHLDLRGRVMMPVHNGTFDLSLHDWHEPFERISALARDALVPLATPEMGERLLIHAPRLHTRWWQTRQAVDAGLPKTAPDAVR